MFKTAFFAAAVLVLGACATQKVSKNTNPSDLAGEWNIMSVSGQPVKTTEKTPFIGFNTAEKRIFGNSGCNLMNGSYQLNDKQAGQISFGRMASTMMMCPDMDTESKVLKAVEGVKAYSIETRKDKAAILNFYDTKGDLIMTLEKK